jgi:DNA processing protein
VVDPFLMLAVAEGFAPSPCDLLLDPHTQPEAWLDGRADRSVLPPAVRARLARPDALRAEAEHQVAVAARYDTRWLTPRDPLWPEALRDVPGRPLALCVRGDASLLRAPATSCAVVGSRTPTAYGEHSTRSFAGALALAGVHVWSGLALGIDAIAHETALETGTPTIAVLAGGLDRIDPTRNGDLAARIVAAGGLLVSEAPIGRRPTRGHFPRRNRILAAAAGAVLVVEAGLASGTMHTAAHAADVGTAVFAVPGSWESPRSRGCHRLIADGAGIAEDPESLLRALGVAAALSGREAPNDPSASLEADDLAVLAVLDRGARPMDLVAREARLPSGRFLEVVFRLERLGFVRALPGDRLERTSSRSLRRARANDRSEG